MTMSNPSAVSIGSTTKTETCTGQIQPADTQNGKLVAGLFNNNGNVSSGLYGHTVGGSAG